MTKTILLLAPLTATFIPLSLAGNINICASLSDGGGPAIGARVDCYDYDPGNTDDYMAGGFLDLNGCVSLSYKTTSTSWFKCAQWWDACLNTQPDIYCVVDDDCLRPLKTTTKDSQNQYSTTDFGRVTTTVDEAYCGEVGYNGCGAASFPEWLREVADDVSGFSPQCNDHDICYSDCLVKRSECDNVFKTDMYTECGGSFFCEILADLFYTAVDVGGNSACRSARSGCTPAQKNLCDAL